MSSSPSTADVALRHKVSYNLALLREYLSERRGRVALDEEFSDLETYDRLAREHTGKPLQDLRVFEIGYGARPFRMLALASTGVDVRGIDMEAPILHGAPHEFVRIARTNGFERLAKSAARFLLYDRQARVALSRELERRGHRLVVDDARFQVGDAAEADPGDGRIDFVYSEDVFEHIDPVSLPKLLDGLHDWLAPGGLAVIRPNVYTGITGGHHLDWGQRAALQPDRERLTPPWGHLRGTAPPVNTYLNRLTRADYREVFGRRFDVEDLGPRVPDLGREYLTGDVARELSDWPDEELFSNQVLFVLRKRAEEAV